MIHLTCVELRIKVTHTDAYSPPAPPREHIYIYIYIQMVLPGYLSGVVVLGVTLLLCFYAMHATYVASEVGLGLGLGVCNNVYTYIPA